MNRPRAWLRQRIPLAPMDLAPWRGAWDDPAGVHLTQTGREALKRARANPGRVRQSAFDLLAADAVLSYACEAALEAADPNEALLTLVRTVAEAE